MIAEFNKENPPTAKDKEYRNEYSAIARDQLKTSFLNDLFTEFGGNTYEGGIFRVHNFGSSFFWTHTIKNYFKDQNSIEFNCFGFDWMGRQYGIDATNALILMFDPATGEKFELEQSINGFFNIDLVEYKSDTLASDTFYHLEGLHNNNLPFSKCLGFKKPLFLGGEDSLENYELVDMEVFWELSYQLYCKAKGLPVGTIIEKIDISH